MIKYAAKEVICFKISNIKARSGGFGIYYKTERNQRSQSLLQPWFCKQGTILPFILREQKPIFDVSQSNVSLICHCVPTAGSRALGWANLVPVINVTEL